MIRPAIFKFLILSILLLSFTACKTNTDNEAEKLARIYCGSCHQFTEPALLDQETWKNRVLPRMALRMGILPQDVKTQSLQDDYYLLSENDLLPNQPLVDQETWGKIRNYYLQKAPDSLPKPDQRVEELNLFTLKTPQINTGKLPAVTFIEHFNNYGTLITSFAGKKLWIDPDQKVPVSVDLIPKIVSHIEPLADQNLLVTFLGDVIRPDAPPSGLVATFTMEDNQLKSAIPLPLPPLYRPTQAFLAELDGREGNELVTCQFGFYQGSLSYWFRDESGKFIEQVIRREPGVLKAEAEDFNEDGLTDLMVLFAHGNERISLLINQGNGKFSEKMILQFPAVYGSSYFTRPDIDGDGLKDIVYTCGDNADLSPVPKPYHGVYIYLNQGNHKYEKVYHCPLNGAYKVVAEDFDLDGDLDLAAVGFFVDEAAPRGFIYLEQLPGFKFKAMTKDLDAMGRWIGITAGDIDQDGDKDIMLGNGYGLSGLDFSGDFKEDPGPPWIILENKSIDADNLAN